MARTNRRSMVINIQQTCEHNSPSGSQSVRGDTAAHYSVMSETMHSGKKIKVATNCQVNRIN